MTDEREDRSEETPEEWRPVVGWEGAYEVSDRCRVRSAKSGRIMKQQKDHDGYYTVGMSIGAAKPWKTKTHRVMLFAFRGEPLPGQEARHLDHDRGNNELRNVVWGTREENDADRVARHAAKKATLPPPPRCVRGGCRGTTTAKEEYCCACRSKARAKGVEPSALEPILRNPDGSLDRKTYGAVGGRARTPAKLEASKRNLDDGRVFRPTLVDVAAMTREEMERRAVDSKTPAGARRWRRRIEKREAAAALQSKIEERRAAAIRRG